MLGMSQKQIDSIVHSEARGNVWDGAVRSGKTFGWILKMLAKIEAYDGTGGIIVVGKNRDSIYRNVFEPIEMVPAFADARPFVKYRQGRSLRHHLRRTKSTSSEPTTQAANPESEA